MRFTPLADSIEEICNVMFVRYHPAVFNRYLLEEVNICGRKGIVLVIIAESKIKYFLCRSEKVQELPGINFRVYMSVEYIVLAQK